jgi:hypothetical protein
MGKQKNPYPFMPKNAPDLWRRVMDVTEGKGVRPYRGLFGGFVELEEYRSNVPRCLRRMEGFAPDEVAAMMGLADDKALYEELFWLERQPEVDIPEYIQEREDSCLKAKRPFPIEMEPDFIYLEMKKREREEAWAEVFCFQWADRKRSTL